jgi:hypothetical protein
MGHTHIETSRAMRFLRSGVAMYRHLTGDVPLLFVLEYTI